MKHSSGDRTAAVEARSRGWAMGGGMTRKTGEIATKYAERIRGDRRGAR